jgi:hypothetical protein
MIFISRRSSGVIDAHLAIAEHHTRCAHNRIAFERQQREAVNRCGQLGIFDGTVTSTSIVGRGSPHTALAIPPTIM